MDRMTRGILRNKIASPVKRKAVKGYLIYRFDTLLPTPMLPAPLDCNSVSTAPILCNLLNSIESIPLTSLVS